MIGFVACTDPGPWTPPEPPVVECLLDEENALRGVCEVVLDEPASARVVLQTDGQEPKLFRSAAVARRHLIPLWGLPPTTDYDWTAVDEGTGAESSGSFSTDRLPAKLRDFEANMDVAEDEREVEAVLLSPSCMPGVVWMVDRDGRIVWWEQVDDAGFGPISGLEWTEDGTVLALAARRRIVEVDVLGNVLLDLRREQDFADYVHHDIARADGHTYVPHSHTVQADGRTWVADGVYVFGPHGALVEDLMIDGLFPRVVAPWMESGYWIREYPGAVDTTHVNAVQIGEDGDVWVSMRHQSAVARFSGGPGTEGFGALELVIAGEESSPLWETAEVVPSGGEDEQFSGQHDPHPGADGSVWMLDNRMLLSGKARAVHYALDEASGHLEQQDSWDTGLDCPVQGTVRELAGGGAVVTCASAGVVFEFAPGRAEPVWQLAPRCGGGSSAGFPRAVPVDLP